MSETDKSILDDRNFGYRPLPVEESSAGRGSAPSSDQQPDLLLFANTEPIPSDPQQFSSTGSSIREPIDITQSVPAEQKHLVAPAGVGAAVLGFLLGGPILSALLGFSSAYAVRKDGTVGDVARSVGEVTLSVKDTASTIEEKHGFFGRTKKAVDDFTGDEKRNSLAFKVRTTVVSCWRSVERYTRENQLLERGVENTGRGIEYVADALNRREKRDDPPTPNNN